MFSSSSSISSTHRKSSHRAAALHNSYSSLLCSYLYNETTTTAPLERRKRKFLFFVICSRIFPLSCSVLSFRLMPLPFLLSIFPSQLQRLRVGRAPLQHHLSVASAPPRYQSPVLAPFVGNLLVPSQYCAALVDLRFTYLPITSLENMGECSQHTMT